MVLVGGPSNAGGLFLDWVARALGADLWSPGPAVTDPGRVPVWQPYLRGERVPFHDRGRRASLHDLDIGMGRPELVRAAFEASAFAVRHIVELSGVEAHRVVATGGGIRNGAWLEALADGTGLPVDPAESPEGAARGAAWLARETSGLEPPGADARRWARHGARVEPDGRRAIGVEDRYGRFRQLVG
jgi:xylulokinase